MEIEIRSEDELRELYGFPAQRAATEHAVAVSQIGHEEEAVRVALAEQRLAGVLRRVPGHLQAHEVALADALGVRAVAEDRVRRVARVQV